MRARVGFWERLKGKVTPALLGSSAITPASGEGLFFPALRDGGAPPLRGDCASRAAPGSAAMLMVKRIGPGRWSEAAEARFFEALAATANVKRAAADAGVSANAVYARRLKRADFRAKWDAVLETGRAAIEMHLVETAKKSFDPDALDIGEVQPRVSVAEAIKIVQLHGSKAQQQSIDAVEPPEEEVEAARERLFNKLQKLLARETQRMLAEGWAHDEEHDHLIPPGWVRAPLG